MIRIEVTSEVKTRTNKSMTFRNQVAYATLPGQKFPVMVFVPLFRDVEPYEPGNYVVSPESFYLDVQYGEPRLAFRLAIVKATGVAAASARA